MNKNLDVYMSESDSFMHFLSVEKENIDESVRFLSAFDKTTIEAIDLCHYILKVIADSFGNNCKYQYHVKSIDNWVRENNLPYDIAWDLIKKAVVIELKDTRLDKTESAKKSVEQIYSIFSRIALLLRAQRDYFLGISEILKLRYTVSFCFIRVQAESIALIDIFNEKPRIAQDWFNATTNELGKIFYNDYHRKYIIPKLKKYNLYVDYNKASYISMHSRIHGLASALKLGNMFDNKKQMAALVYQEIDKPDALLFWLYNYLYFHNKMISIFFQIIPELKDSQIDKLSEYENFLKCLNSLKDKYI